MKNRENESKIVKYLLIGISVLFLFVMLVLPLFVVVTEALKKGWEVYVEAVTDSYTIAALMLTLKATVIAVVCNTVLGLCAAWAVTRFQFKGKKLLTTLIDVPVTVSPIIAGLIYLLIFGKQSILIRICRRRISRSSLQFQVSSLQRYLLPFHLCSVSFFLYWNLLEQMRKRRPH